MLRLRAAAHPAVPGGSPGLQPLPAEAKLLPDLPRPAEPEHPEPGDGEGGVHAAVPLQGETRSTATSASRKVPLDVTVGSGPVPRV